MDKNQYKEMISDLMSKNSKLEKENLKLTIALCNLRDEYLDMGGDPKQLELFDESDSSQLNIFDDEKWIYESPDGKTIFRRPMFSSNPKEKEEIVDGKPTGRTFDMYSVGKKTWDDKGK
tara:strand:+ start:186 stop:542 length:357 start_codon:yes stop_codon:yes gene_type:complete